MATTFSGSINLALKGYLTKTLDIGTASLAIDYNKKFTQTNGTGADQGNMIWSDTRTISASSTDDIDLYGGISNAFGDTINFTCVKGIVVYADPDNINNVLIGGDGSAAVVNWVGASNDVIVVKPGGIFMLYDPSAGGYGVTNTSADVLQIANSSSGSSVDYDIIIIGEV